MDIIAPKQKPTSSFPPRQMPPPALPRPAVPPQPQSKSKLRLAGAVIVIIALITGGLYVYLPQAAITVKARSEPVTRDFEIRVDQNLQSASSADLAIPGKIIEREVSGQKKFTATGTKNVGKTASGFVTIYNFSNTTLILKKDTTELTINGRKFFFTQDASGIRPTARIGLEDEEIDETSLVPPAPLVASAPGEEFNLPVGARLEINNFAFGAQPKILYAVATAGISGGSTKLAKFVTQGDIDSAYLALSRELLDESRGEILENAFTSQVVEQQSESPAGTETAEFRVNMKMKIRALTYDEAQLKNIIYERIKRLLPKEKILSEDSARIDVKFASLDLSQGQGILQAHFEGAIVYLLDQTELLEKIRGKSADEIREIFLSKPEIDSLEVRFSPFWVKSAPKLRGKIQIQIQD